MSLTVYNVAGQRLATLVDRPLPAGNHVVDWDGTQDNGDMVPFGMYFYRLSTPYASQTRKMLLVK